MVEAAIIVPIIVLLLGCIVTFGQIIFGKQVVQQAAYEGARKAVVNTSAQAGRSIADSTAQAMLRQGLALKNFRSSFTTNGPWKKGNLLTYTVTADAKTLFPIINSKFKPNSQTPVTGKITMMIERG
jgi:Flp pilus assembly protein TadG